MTPRVKIKFKLTQHLFQALRMSSWGRDQLSAIKSGGLSILAGHLIASYSNEFFANVSSRVHNSQRRSGRVCAVLLQVCSRAANSG